MAEDVCADEADGACSGALCPCGAEETAPADADEDGAAVSLSVQAAMETAKTAAKIRGANCFINQKPPELLIERSTASKRPNVPFIIRPIE